MRTPPRRALWSWALYDWAGQSFAMVQTFVFAAYFTRRIATETDAGTTAWSLTIGLTGLLVAVTGLIAGAATDRSGRRRPALFGFTVLGAVGIAAIVTVRPDPAYVPLALALLALSVYGTQTAMVFYNAMLGDLSPRVDYGRWSARGWALGYAGGVVCMLVVLVLFLGDRPRVPLPDGEAMAVRASFPFVALWLVAFSLPLLLFTPDARPSGGPATTPAGRGIARTGLDDLRGALASLRGRPSLLRFLVGRMFYMDGLATIFALGGVYAAGTFAMDERAVLAFGIALNLAAGVGALAFSVVEARLGPRRAILAALLGLLAFSVLLLLAPDRRWLWIFGLALGLFVGPVQSSSRSWLSHAAPAELRGQLFGLYALADKATSFLGPLIVGALTAALGSQRLGLVVVPVFFALGWIALRGVHEAAPPETTRRAQ